MGMETVGFLMLAHRISPAGSPEQARIMVDAGAQCVYVVDSAGALILGDAQERVPGAHDRDRRRRCRSGFHGHQNLSLGVANSRARGAERRPADRRRPVRARRGRGQRPDRGAGRHLRPARHHDRCRCATARWPRPRTCVQPTLPGGQARLPIADRSAITQGYRRRLLQLPAARRAGSERYGVPAHEILQRVGEARLRRRSGRHDHRHRDSAGRAAGRIAGPHFMIR